MVNKSNKAKDKRTSDDALRESELRQSLILKSIPVAMYATKAYGDFGALYISENIKHITGFEADKFIADNKFWHSRIHPEDKQQALDEMQEVLSKENFELEYRWKCADGTYRWFLDKAVLITAENTEPKEIVGTWLDITDRKVVEQSLKTLVEKTASVTGVDFFRVLIRNMASSLDVKYAFVSKCINSNKKKVRTLAFWSKSKYGENFEYDLEGTPCEKVISGEFCCYNEKVAELFPADEDLKKFDAQGYLGIPLSNSKGSVIGHLAVFHDKPFKEISKHFSILQLFAIRAGSELERMIAEESLRLSNKQLSKKSKHEEIINSVTKSVHQSIDIQEVYENAVESLINNLEDVDKVSIYNVEGDEAVIKASRGTPDWYIQRAGRVPYPKGFTWKVIIDGTPRYCPDTEKDEFIGPSGRELGINSYLSMPIKFENKNIGVINLTSLKKNSFDKAELELMEIVSNQIEIAVSNAKQADDLEKALNELNKLKKRLESENIYLKEEIKTEHNFEEIIGESKVLKEVLRQVEMVANTDSTVLIRGDTGTGKERIARAIHNLSSRKQMTLIKVNCPAIPSGLIESELFGHEKGAFTGALTRKIGKFELADGGTIFLDELGDLPLDAQAKLLRVLQEREFERVGSNETRKVDVRVIAATNRNLETAVKEGKFRADLYYRLNVFPITLPALSERREDIPVLTMYFTQKYANKMGKEIKSVSEEDIESLKNYSWPGNIRELENIVERAVIVSTNETLNIDKTLVGSLPEPTSREDESLSLESLEREHIIMVLNKCNWQIHGEKGAAHILGINPSTLRSRMGKLGIKKEVKLL
ncbi:MAG: sigma 54-interacting transcriptional regulator [Deltaproteobacteria bacterium]